MRCKHCLTQIIRGSNAFDNDPYSFCPYCGKDIKEQSYARANIEFLPQDAT